jgi:hypothetical protein
MAAVAYLLIHVVISAYMNAVGHRVSIHQLRKAFSFARSLPRYMSMLYVTVSALLFLMSLGLIVISMTSSPPAAANVP